MTDADTDDGIPYGVKARVATLAREYPAVQYDPDDPFCDAIATYCHMVGVEPIPTPGITPRTIRGAQSSTAVPREVAAIAAALHQLVCRVMPGATDRVCDEDNDLAAALLTTLNARGWRIAADPRAGAWPRR